MPTSLMFKTAEEFANALGPHLEHEGTAATSRTTD